MRNYQLEFKGKGTPKEIQEQLKGLIEIIEEHKNNPEILDGYSCEEEEGYPHTFLISEI